MEIVIGSSRVADAWFLVDQVVHGVTHKHFSPSLLLPAQRLDLLRQCCSALLSETWDRFLGRAPIIGTHNKSTLIVAKSNGKTVGAALIETNLRTGEVPIVNIDVVVVDERYQGLGIGSTLLREVMDRAVIPSRLFCACTPYSPQMLSMVERVGFKKVRSPGMLNGVSTPYVYECHKSRIEVGQIGPGHAEQRPRPAAKLVF
jgi:GNAT superfamily N-acetyltransferase